MEPLISLPPFGENASDLASALLMCHLLDEQVGHGHLRLRFHHFRTQISTENY
jgi:hypothetical protein